MSDNLIFIDFGIFSVYWYGVFIGCAIFVASILFSILRRIQGMEFSDGLTLSIIAMPAALIGSRVFYCWFSKVSLFDGIEDRFNLMSGGDALYGALIGVMSVLIINSAIHRESALQIIDSAVPALSAAICIGRFASITSGDDMGFVLSDKISDKLPFVIRSQSDGTLILWVGFFEGIAALIIFGLTMMVFMLTYKQNSQKKFSFDKGSTAIVFMTAYGLSQTVLESMRSDSLFMVTLGFVRISQIISFAMAVAAFVIIIIKNCRVHKPSIYDIIIWAVCAASLGIAVYCEFSMNSADMTRNYIMMSVSLGIIMIEAMYLLLRNSTAIRENKKIILQ